MGITIENALSRIAQRVVDNTQNIRQKDHQRRHNFVDMYGVEFTRQGDSGTPARFYLSISPDVVYLERFEFKLIVQPFASYSNGMETAVVEVNDTSLSVTESGNTHTITPNPHKHTTDSHTHNLTSGIALTHTSAGNFRVSIEGIDVTPYLMAQYGAWVDGEGVFPSLDINKNYDILEVACDMVAEGRESDADRLVHPGYKEVRITADAPFQVTLVLYSKYSHMNR